MIKLKTPSRSQNNLTTKFGYGLFALTVLSYGFSILTTAVGDVATKSLVAVLGIFAAAVIVPVFVAYIIGYRATSGKEKSVKRYNGVILGVAAFLFSQTLTLIMYRYPSALSTASFESSVFFTNVIPVIVTVLVAGLIGMTYAQQSRQVTLLHHRPFQFILVASSLVYFGLSSTTFGLQPGVQLMYTLTTSLLPIIIVAVAYRLVGNSHSSVVNKFTDAFIALGFATITLVVIYPTISFLQNNSSELLTIVSVLIALAVVAAYLLLRRRAV